jgi:hypothetical protein
MRFASGLLVPCCVPCMAGKPLTKVLVKSADCSDLLTDVSWLQSEQNYMGAVERASMTS